MPGADGHWVERVELIFGLSPEIEAVNLQLADGRMGGVDGQPPRMSD